MLPITHHRWCPSGSNAARRSFRLAWLVFVIASSASFAQSPTWSQRATTGPGRRYGHRMAYDSDRGVTVLYGGDAINDDQWTWEWNGTWTNRSMSGPGSLYGHALAYDAVRHLTILFGGSNTSGYHGDTWGWNGTTWTLKTSSGPDPRYGHAMAFDSSRGVIVLFGGFAGGPSFGDTWEFDGTTWTRRATTGPSPRQFAAMAFDSARNVTVLFGGADNHGVFFGDTWEWNGSSWALRTSSGPAPREAHALVFDSDRSRTVLFGGEDGSTDYVPNETWEWDGTNWALTATAGATARWGHAMAYDSARSVTVLFGGYADTRNGETWEYACVNSPGSASANPNPACPGQSVTLSASGGSGGTYTWYAGGCGSGTSIGTGSSITITAPNAATTYFARIASPCGNSACTSTMLNISGLTAPPTSAMASPSAACSGQSVTLTATGGSGGTIKWYATACGSGPSIGTGSSINISAPNSTTTYFARTEGCSNSSCVSTTISVTQLATPPTSATASPSSACPGQSVTLTASGGSGGTYTWYADDCGSGSPIGTGASINVMAPSNPKTYFVRIEGSCENPNCASVTLVPSLTAPTSATAETRSTAPGTLMLKAMGGSSEAIKWYVGGCGSSTGTFQGYGRVLVINAPYQDTTYFVRIEDTCGSSDCASVTYQAQKAPCLPSVDVSSGLCGASGTCLMPMGLLGWLYLTQLVGRRRVN